MMARQAKPGSRKGTDTYWEQTPTLDLPHEKLSFFYYYGLYKFAGLTNPTGSTARLVPAER